jgi:phospholipid transport system substrate-binding protein
MELGSLRRMILAMIVTLAIAIPAWGGEPTDRIKGGTDKIIAVLSDPGLLGDQKAEERRLAIRKAVDELFDWEEMAKRSLARHWRERSDEEKKEFVVLYGKLLERTYLDRVEGYSGEEVIYTEERIDGKYALVKVKIVSKTKQEIAVDYRLKNKKEEWLVYDVSVEGVSLVNNYRTQFNQILMKSSYESLVERLKEKIERQ